MSWRALRPLRTSRSARLSRSCCGAGRGEARDELPSDISPFLSFDAAPTVGLPTDPNPPSNWVGIRHKTFLTQGFSPQIGRASCRERGCQYVLISVGAVTLKKKHIVA